MQIQEIVNHTSFELPKSTTYEKLKKLCTQQLPDGIIGRDIYFIETVNGVIIRHDIAKRSILSELRGDRTEKYCEQAGVIEMVDITAAEWLTTSEADELWGLTPGETRQSINRSRLKKYIPYGLIRKTEKAWLVSKEAMLREYGEPKKEVVINETR